MKLPRLPWGPIAGALAFVLGRWSAWRRPTTLPTPAPGVPPMIPVGEAISSAPLPPESTIAGGEGSSADPLPIVAPTPKPAGPPSLAWGAKVSPAFRELVRAISARLGCEPDHLMACMAFETAGTFSPSIRNAAGSGAVGLIQFMPSTATALGTSTAALARMTAEEQLDYVERYFLPYVGKLGTVDDLYLAILWPKAVGRPEGYVLFAEPSAAYRMNRALDRDRDGKVTKAEAASAVRAMLAKGRQAKYLA